MDMCQQQMDEEQNGSSAAAVDQDSFQAIEERRAKERAILSTLLVVLPMVSGVLLTLLNAFHPYQKHSALEWAAQKIEMEMQVLILTHPST